MRFLPHAVVIANSTATAECARTYGFCRLAVSPLATDMQPVAPADAVESFVLFVGPLVELEGCGWFISNVLPKLLRHIRLRVAGTVWSKSERTALRHSRVNYIGPKSPHEIAELYARALCVVVPNIDFSTGQFEGFELLAAEAFVAGGVPVDAAHGSLRDAVVDGVTGLLPAFGDHEAWVEKIAEISHWGPEKRAAFVQRATKAT